MKQAYFLQKVENDNHLKMSIRAFDDLSVNDAKFIHKDFSNFYFYSCEFENTNFFGCDFRDCTFKYCTFSNCNLSSSSFVNTLIESSRFIDCSIKCADFSGSEMFKVDMTGSILSNSIFDEKERIRKGMVLTEPMIGYKKCALGKIVTLEIPADAVVFSINNGKCRTHRAKVIDITHAGKKCRKAVSLWDDSFVYIKGKYVNEPKFSPEYNIECTSGIHFFRTLQEAIDY